jgi:phosphopantothenoylcysteine decarboxylase/phosphopantothenate--cysteine ligase
MERATRIVLGICGGIAAYKMPQLVRLLQKNGFDVTAVLTPDADGLVGREALRVVSRHPVYCEDRPASHDLAHIELARWAQYLLVCPASANTIAKLSHGIADNLLTTLALSFEGRLIVAPAMNSRMWANKTTQENIALLKSHGATVLPVDQGELACGEEGPGRLLPLESIVRFAAAKATPPVLGGKRVLISSGPTAEPIDAVRVITNRSSGRMGAALAEAALLAGADVCVVTGPARAPLPPGCRAVCVCTAAQMKAALDREFDKCDVCIMAAAVADFAPKKAFAGKQHRDETGEWRIDLVPTPDIAAGLGRKKKRQVLVCFSLEDGPGTKRPLAKMEKKNCDMMIVNGIGSSLESDHTTIRILQRGKRPRSLGRMPKSAAAAEIIGRIGLYMEKKHG